MGLMYLDQWIDKLKLLEVLLHGEVSEGINE